MVKRKQSLFDLLVAEIITRKFKPGERLVERELVTHFGVSRTPLREAIRRLEEIGLVQCFPNRGATVIDFSPTDIENLYLIRINLEHLVAKFAFSNLGANEIAAMERINQELRTPNNLIRLIEKDKQFHHIIYEASGNRFLVEIIEELRLKCYIVAYYAWGSPNRVRTSFEGHKEIITSIKNKDREKFQNLLELQLVAAKSFYIQNLR
jgi:DNA-binding GntR family transcriptional regulator